MFNWCLWHPLILLPSWCHGGLMSLRMWFTIPTPPHMVNGVERGSSVPCRRFFRWVGGAARKVCWGEPEVCLKVRWGSEGLLASFGHEIIWNPLHNIEWLLMQACIQSNIFDDLHLVIDVWTFWLVERMSSCAQQKQQENRDAWYLSLRSFM